MFDYPKVSPEDRAEAMQPVSADHYRLSPLEYFDPDEFRSGTFPQGVWFQFGGYRKFYAWCRDCGALSVEQIELAPKGKNKGWNGHYCSDCSEARYEAHNKAAAERMRRLRASRVDNRRFMDGTKWERGVINRDLVAEQHHRDKLRMQRNPESLIHWPTPEQRCEIMPKPRNPQDVIREFLGEEYLP